MFSTAGNGQTANVWGKVVDKQTQKPIYGVNVSLQNNPRGLGTITNKKGEFRLWDIPADTAKILISYNGYQNYILDLHALPESGSKNNMTVIYLNEKSVSGHKSTGKLQAVSAKK